MKLYILFIVALLFGSCKGNDETTLPRNNSLEQIQKDTITKIPILNFATFHMGQTSDANSTEFNEYDKKNKNDVHKIAEMLSEFKPTVIIVEKIPERNELLQTEYKNYVDNPNMTFERTSEIQLLAYELGRICNTKRIYGIDHKMDYNYKIAREINNTIDSVWYLKYHKNPLAFHSGLNISNFDMFDNLSLFEKLKIENHDSFLDFLIAINADMLTHAGTKNGFEGADEAAKYYQRNLRMYSNLNRIELNKDDRVFILMGGSHTAFFRDFISRSPKYEMVNTFDYLK